MPAQLYYLQKLGKSNKDNKIKNLVTRVSLHVISITMEVSSCKEYFWLPVFMYACNLLTFSVKIEFYNIHMSGDCWKLKANINNIDSYIHVTFKMNVQ